MDISFWLPLLVLFAGAVIGAIVRRHAKDECLKIFHESFVFVRLKDGKWIWGKLIVYANGLELLYSDPDPLGTEYRKLSYVIYDYNMETIDRIVRPSPKPGTTAAEEWKREIRALQYPNFGQRFARQVRNTFNMLRDAVAQSIGMIFGAVKKRNAHLSQLSVDDNVTQVGKTLISIVPSAYEPVLEKYLGQKVVVETPLPDKVIEQIGILQEYNGKYVLVRDVVLMHEFPPGVNSAAVPPERFDVVFPRPAHVIRHLASSVS